MRWLWILSLLLLKSEGFRFSAAKKREMQRKKLATLKANGNAPGKAQIRSKPVETARGREAVNSKDVEIALNTYSRPGSPKTYVAEITGTGGRFGLQRDFLDSSGGSSSASGKTGTRKYKLKEGRTYEIAEAYKDRRYVKIENGEAKPVGKPATESSSKPNPDSRFLPGKSEGSDSKPFSNTSGVEFDVKNSAGDEFRVSIPKEGEGFFSFYSDGKFKGSINGRQAEILLAPEMAQRIKNLKKR